MGGELPGAFENPLLLELGELRVAVEAGVEGGRDRGACVGGGQGGS